MYGTHSNGGFQLRRLISVTFKSIQEELMMMGGLLMDWYENNDDCRES